MSERPATKTWAERRAEEIAGPFIVWTDYGCEGWQPESYGSLKEALEAPSHGENKVITKPVKYEVVESDAL